MARPGFHYCLSYYKDTDVESMQYAWFLKHLSIRAIKRNPCTKSNKIFGQQKTQRNLQGLRVAFLMT